MAFDDLKESCIASVEKLLHEMQTPSYRSGASAAGVSSERLAAEYIVGMFTSRIDGATGCEELIDGLRRIKAILTVPAAEYVPAIGDAFVEIDRLLGARGLKV